MRLAGKVALVTGAGRGIGRAIALAFAAEGASVVMNYLHSAAGAEEAVREAEALGVRALAVRADVSQAQEVAEMVNRALAEFGKLDILVNNAAVFSQAPLFSVTEELWDRIVGVNLKGVFLCSQAAARAMVAQGAGNIINIASGGGLSARPGYDASVAYVAAKAGVIMLTRRLAIELAPHIRVNSIAPGFIDSKPKRWDEVTRHRYGQRAPLKRVGEPADIAAAAVFLASEEAAFITGQTICIDGGIIMH